MEAKKERVRSRQLSTSPFNASREERDDVEGVVLGRQVHVRGKQGFNEPFTDLTVGIGQTIDLEITVIALNGQITALVEHRWDSLSVP